MSADSASVVSVTSARFPETRRLAGVMTSGELRSAGFSKSAIRALVPSGRWCAEAIWPRYAPARMRGLISSPASKARRS